MSAHTANLTIQQTLVCFLPKMIENRFSEILVLWKYDKRARKRDAPQGAVPCVFEIRSQGRKGIGC